MVTFSTEPDHFASAADLLAADDHIEMDVKVTGWAHTLRIRSLTVPQREKVNRLAGVGDKRDWTIFHAYTLVEGIVRPRLNPTQAQTLVEYHNGQLVEELSEAIWSLGSLFTVYADYQKALEARDHAKEQLPDGD